MTAIRIKPGVYWIGVNDRTTDLFEGLWPITREGVSYNSYLIDDEKTAIIDLTKSFKGDEYFDQINELTDLKKIDYVVINHMEPDHSGLLRTLRRIASHVTLVGSEKTRQMLEEFFSIKENVQVVKEGDTLNLGKRTLNFFSTPFVHWPETIMTYETSHRILFSCDGFGSYGAIQGAIFDDECKNFDFYKREALRYYANIVASFSTPVLKAIEKLKGLPVEVIAPSHGLIWRKNPGQIVSLYKKWAEYAGGEREPGITLVYGSMYGHTETAINAAAQGISRKGVPLQVFDASRTHVSYILPSLWSQKGVLVGAPTYEVSLFPPVAEVLNMASLKHIRHKKGAFLGSYGWSGGALRKVQKIVEPLKWEFVDTLEFAGGPTREDLQKAEKLGEKLAEEVKQES